MYPWAYIDPLIYITDVGIWIGIGLLALLAIGLIGNAIMQAQAARKD